MRYVLVGLLALSSLGPAHAQDAALAGARARLARGNYAEAREQFEKLSAQEKFRVPAAVGLSRAWRAEGEYDKAGQVLQAALRDLPRDPDLLAEQADLLYFRGDWDAADQAARQSLLASKDQFLAHWVLARLHADRGELDRSGQELVWFVRAYAAAGEDLPPEAYQLIGLAAVERARRDSRLNDQFQFVLTEIWADLAKKHPDFWEAEFARGLLFQEKYADAYAQRAFHKALAVNPRSAEVLAAKGVSALDRYQMEDAEKYADQSLAVNPRLPEALRLKADVYLTAGDTARALEFLEKALAVNPRSEATLARVAACRELDGDAARLQEIIQRVEKQDPKAGRFYFALAERLEVAKRFHAAERSYQKSAELRPDLAPARNQIGLLYMRLGEEEKAREVLDAAFADDPFNVRVYNTLQVLDHLKEYQTLKTAHFLIRYDPKNDPVLVRFLAKYLEGMYDELARQFRHEPKGPILIEVFNKHEMFSGRVVALPDLHTIGACTGKMVAMVSPHDKSGVVDKPFNWNRVVRHELVHIFNLDQTGFLVPHWFTEGLAVRAEDTPMPPVWHRLLAKRVADDDLLTLDNVNLGFIRPGSSEEWQLAYLQSKLYVDYLTRTHGEAAVAGMLDAYKEGLGTAAALEKVCKVSVQDFEAGYRKFLQGMVAGKSGGGAEKTLSLGELKERHAQEPANPDVAAELADRYFLLGNKEKAGELATGALEQKENHPLATYVLARLDVANGKAKEAEQRLEAAVDPKQPEPEVLKLLGSLKFAGKNFRAAAGIFELGHKAEPYDNYWLVQMARCYRQTGQTDAMIAALEKLAPMDYDDLASRRELAKLLAEKGDHAGAERWAWSALEIDVLDGTAREILQEALQAQGKEAELTEFRKLIGGE